MKILVTGATGFLGTQVVRALLRRKHHVRAMVRPGVAKTKFDGEPSVEIYRADLRSNDDLLPAFEEIDVVIHLAAVVAGSEEAQLAGTVVGTERLLDAMKRSKTRRFVLASTLSVYDWGKPWFSLTEDSQLESRANLYRRDGYAISKTWQERIVRRIAESMKWDLIILRPGFIWGKGNTWCVGAGIDLGPVRLVNGPFRRLPLTHVNNCADAFAAAAECTPKSQTILNVFDSDVVQAWRFASDYKSAANDKRFLIPVPYYFGFVLACCAAATARVLFGRNYRLPTILNPLRYRAMFRGLHFPNQRTMKRLGWTPAVSYTEGLDLSHQHTPEE